jgi:Protein of unknown function (DUF3365)
MKHASVQTQLIARLLIILTGFGILLFFSLNLFLRSLMETEMIDKGRLIFANLLAVQTYVRETLRPAMYESLPQGDFVMEAMSTSYVTRKVMSDLNTARTLFSYRRVATEPRNPEYVANELEQKLIRHFQNHPDEQIFSQFRSLENEECYITARPVVFEKSCLACHGRPEDAPAVMLTRYGVERGFERLEGEIGGLDMLIIPIERNIMVIRQLTLTFILIFACGTLFIIGFNYFFFDRIMLQNINRLATVLRSRFPDEARDSLHGNPCNGDEIESMVSDMEQFAYHLSVARSQLSDYALNLEIKVEARTAELSREAEARLKDVQLFLDVLDLFAKDMDRQWLLDRTLTAIASRFNANSAAIHCFYSMNRHTWPAGMESLALQVSQRDMLINGKDIFLPDAIIVPVFSGTAIRGALDLRWNSPVAHPPRQREVLLAVGRQLGIALENLDAMENILRQKAVLESIFEGIADPLFSVGQFRRCATCQRIRPASDFRYGPHRKERKPPFGFDASFRGRGYSGGSGSAGYIIAHRQFTDASFLPTADAGRRGSNHRFCTRHHDGEDHAGQAAKGGKVTGCRATGCRFGARDQQPVGGHSLLCPITVG